MSRETLFRSAALFAILSLGALSAAATAREPVAKVHGSAVYRDETSGSVERLRQRITGPLLKRFAADEHLSVTVEEVDDFESAMQATLPTMRQNLAPAERAAFRKMAEGTVLTWKIDKALYQRFGGKVIFQQANPLEPVEAQRKFFEEQEKAGTLVFLDGNVRRQFYEYYLRDHPFVVPPSQVNYDKPWWHKQPVN